MKPHSARTLALRFDRPIVPRDARRLRLTFGVQEQVQPPDNPDVAPNKRRQIPALDVAIGVSGSLNTQTCTHVHNGATLSVLGNLNIQNSKVYAVSGCLNPSWQQHFALLKQHTLRQNTLHSLRNCFVNTYANGLPLMQCAAPQQGITQYLQQCAHSQQSALNHAAACAQATVSPLQWFAHCASTRQSAANLLSGCLNNHYSQAVPPPCEWYEIKLPETDNKPNKRVCGDLPPSNRLPLTFSRRQVEQDSRRLRLTFSCNSRHIIIPALDSYMILNNISASADGEPLALLSANIAADTSGYYWSGDMTLPPDDFARLNLDGRDDDCVIELVINGETFRILAESYRDNRQFARRSYTVSGRSLTAKLGADYAVSYQGFITQPRNARQIADEAIAPLGIELDWQIDDWLVPANVYSRSDKTPMAILADIAQAAGAFVESHPSEAKISIKPRWRVPAWELNQASAAVSVPANVILSISGSKTINAQANGVFVWGAHPQGFAADVWREGSNREPRAAAQNHVLYTAAEVCRMAGIAALSQTGTHKQESVQLPLSPKYNINRAQLGRVWRFNEPNGAWQGIVTGVSISAENSDGAVKVLQTLMIDRYLGN